MDIFLDTEFIGFKELSPLSLGFCPVDNELPSAYFELAIEKPDISLLDEEGQLFMTTEVLSQIGVARQLDGLTSLGIRCVRDGPNKLENAIYRYLSECSEIAKSKKEKIWLVSDYSGDFAVLKKFVPQDELNSLWIREIFVDKLVPELWRAQSAYIHCQSTLFKEGLLLGDGVKLNRHHAFFDAWVMAQSYKEALLHAF